MKKKLFSFLLVFVMVFMCIMPITTSATALEVADAYEVKITTYEELVKYLYNSPNGERYVLQNDIIVSDNKNDYEIVVSAFSDCTLDLNGHTLYRGTRGIDTTLIKTQTDSPLIWIENQEPAKSVYWYTIEDNNYLGEDTNSRPTLTVGLKLQL